MCPEIAVDFTQCLDAVPAGTYKAQIVDASLETSKKGDPYVKWKFSIFGSDDTRCNGQFVWTNTMLTGPGAFRLKGLVTAAMGKAPEGKLNTDDLMGKQVVITLTDGVDQHGNKSNYPEVKAVKALV